MKKILFTLCLFLGMAVSMTAAESATALLDRAANHYRVAKSITAGYTMSADGSATAGSITVSGTRFYISSPDMTVWYDGKTQWSYSPAINEVNITEPTAEELQQVNPFAIIQAFRRAYKAGYVGKANGVTRQVQLTALNPRDEIRKAIVTMNTSTLFPASIVLTMTGNKTITIKVSSARVGATLPMSTFRFEKKKAPKAQVVDLR